MGTVAGLLARKAQLSFLGSLKNHLLGAPRGVGSTLLHYVTVVPHTYISLACIPHVNVYTYIYVSLNSRSFRPHYANNAFRKVRTAHMRDGFPPSNHYTRGKSGYTVYTVVNIATTCEGYNIGFGFIQRRY